jgi:exopolysaccharide biosynthesis polyprenyl glycosylphosphotransferase
LPLINLNTPALSGYQRMAKRAFDLIVASLTTLMILPVMTLVAIIIKLDSPGPVFFRQERIGEHGRSFKMYKFRSMVVNAEALQDQISQLDEYGNIIHKVRNDPRVTRVGRIIRKTSLDELPQFLNVIKGEMSLVGPRPELPKIVAQYQPWQRQRFIVPQGITGWWQINGRSDKPCHLNTDEDLYYIKNYSFWLDIQILFKTIPALLRGKGAF